MGKKKEKEGMGEEKEEEKEEEGETAMEREREMGKDEERHTQRQRQRETVTPQRHIQVDTLRIILFPHRVSFSDNYSQQKRSGVKLLCGVHKHVT